MTSATPAGKTRLGAIAFINTLPVYFDLDQTGVDLHYDHPAALNAMMSDGKLDVSPVSSAHYWQHKNDYVLLDDLSVSSPGAVESVLFVSKHELGVGLKQFERIAVPNDSATSVQLLSHLIRTHAGCDLSGRFEVYPAADYQKALETTGCALVIGDNALLLSEAGVPQGNHLYDLSSLWKEATGLPFVFAVWVANRAWAQTHPEQLAAVNRALCESRERFFADHNLMQRGLSDAAGRCKISEDRIRRYYTQCLNYRLDTQHRHSLEQFGAVLDQSAQDALPREPQFA